MEKLISAIEWIGSAILLTILIIFIRLWPGWWGLAWIPVVWLIGWCVVTICDSAIEKIEDHIDKKDQEEWLKEELAKIDKEYPDVC